MVQIRWSLCVSLELHGLDRCAGLSLCRIGARMSMPSDIRLLLVEDSLRDAALLCEVFAEDPHTPFHVTHVTSLSDAEAHLSTSQVDVIVLDLGLPDAAGAEAVQRARAAAPLAPIVVLTGLDDEMLAQQVMQAGAQEHLIKGQIDRRGLLRAIRYATERKNIELQRDEIAEALFIEKERAQVTLHCIGDAVVCTDSSGCVTFLNPEAEKLTAWPAAEALGGLLSEVVCLIDGATRAVVVPEASGHAGHKGKTCDSSNYLLLGRNGAEVPVESTAAAIRDRQGAT